MRAVTLRLLAPTLLSTLIIPACGGQAADQESDQEADAEVDTRTVGLSIKGDEQDPNYVRTPFGLMHRSCVYSVEDREQISPDGLSTRAPDGTVRRRTPCRFERRTTSASFVPQTNGWVDYSTAPAAAGATQAFVRLDGAWNVPASPPNSSGNQLLYFFPSFVPSNNSVIIQPVLQWGVGSSSGGGRFWGIASWIVDSAMNASFSPLVSVNSGDTIVGRMMATSCTTNFGNCQWSITASRGAQSTTLNVSVTNKVFNTVQRGVLEVYNVDTCDQYPANVRGVPFINFVNVNVYQPTAGAVANGNPQNSITNTTNSLAYTAVVNPVAPNCCMGQTSSGPTNISLVTVTTRSGVCHF